MAYHIKLIRGLSYTGFGGKVKATRKNPVATVEDKAIANAAVASGFFKLIEEADEARVLTGHLDATQLEGMDTKDLKALAIRHRLGRFPYNTSSSSSCSPSFNSCRFPVPR